MRVTSIELHPSNSSNVYVLSFRDPTRQNSYNVRTINGLDADVIVPKYYGASGDSETTFYNLSPEKREIVIRVELNPNFGTGETYSSLRDALYKIIASSRSGLIQIQFKDGTTVKAVISGWITKFEGAHFTKIPEVQITIQTEDPWLKAPTITNLSVVGLDPTLTNIQDLESTAPHGFNFQMKFLGNLATLSIGDHNDTSWSFDVTPNGGFLTNDEIHFSSDYDNKVLYVVRGANTIYLGDAIVPGSVWPIIFPGDNEFVFDNPSSLEWQAISYYHCYWGV